VVGVGLGHYIPRRRELAEDAHGLDRSWPTTTKSLQHAARLRSFHNRNSETRQTLALPSPLLISVERNRQPHSLREQPPKLCAVCQKARFRYSSAVRPQRPPSLLGRDAQDYDYSPPSRPAPTRSNKLSRARSPSVASSASSSCSKAGHEFQVRHVFRPPRRIIGRAVIPGTSRSATRRPTTAAAIHRNGSLRSSPKQTADGGTASRFAREKLAADQLAAGGTLCRETICGWRRAPISVCRATGCRDRIRPSAALKANATQKFLTDRRGTRFATKL